MRLQKKGFSKDIVIGLMLQSLFFQIIKGHAFVLLEVAVALPLTVIHGVLPFSWRINTGSVGNVRIEED